ncbi:hypothetical protein [Helicobacter equorum]|uniref:hypothetical protein n=1 Tax=Helicobacter equorum TaxID=361872 RepID=UPI000CF06111|nr:hypothetical protein [Helicobacter equorum]
MHELADIFEPITPWAMPLIVVGICAMVVCIICAYVILHKRQNPIIQHLKSLDTQDSKKFAKEFSALVAKAKTKQILNQHALTKIQEFLPNLNAYKFSKNPPPLDSVLLTQYQHICENL